MSPDETYLIANLTSVASGQTRGRFCINEYWAKVFLRLIEAPPMHVQFHATEDFVKRLNKFQKRSDMKVFSAMCYELIQRAANSSCALDVGRRTALGLFCLFNEDVRKFAETGEQTEDFDDDE